MPKEKKLTNIIPGIYKKNAESMMLFAWVRAQKKIIPTITLEQSIGNYFKEFGISYDQWSIESAKVTYERLQTDYFEDCRS